MKETRLLLSRIATLSLILGMITLISCDPARILVVKAADKPNVSVTIYSNKNILPYSNDSIDKIIIKIPETDTSIKHDTTFFYGLGGWGNDSLMPNFSQNIDSIIIVNSKEKVMLDNQTDINTYLLKNRHGFAKRILTIEAK